MKINKKYFDLDCGRMGNQFTVEGIHQGDVNTSELIISLLNDDDEFEVNQNCVVRIYGVKPDGTKLCNECKVDEYGDIHYMLKEQDTTVSGIVNYQLIISGETDGEVQVLASPCFDCYVEPRVVNFDYVELKFKPIDWDTAYNKYFKKDEKGYVSVESVSDWEEGKIYFCDGFVESSHQLDVLTNLIHKVQNLSTEDGVIDGLEINNQGELVLKFSNGNEKILGTVKGADGASGKDGEVIAVTNIIESTEDAGSNIVNFSNGVTLTVKNGSKGSDGEKGEKGEKGDIGAQGIQGEKGEKGDDGYTPVKGVDYYTETEKLEIITQVLDTINGSSVFGYIDDNNTIVVSGKLDGGAYTVKYEMEDGSTIDIGDLVLDNNVYYSIVNTLTNCTNDNSATQAVQGDSYFATISAKSGYELSSVTVKMGGTDISGTAVSGGTITIANVTGNTVITAVAVEKQAAEPVTETISLLDSTSLKGTNYDEDRTGTMGHCATPLIDLTNIPKPCTINLTGARWVYDSDSESGYIRFHVSDTAGNKVAGGYTCPGFIPDGMSETHDTTAKTATITITSNDIGYVRFAGFYTYGNDGSTFADASATLTYTPAS